MISPFNTSINASPIIQQPLSRQTQCQLLELVKNQENVINDQKIQISKFQKELKEMKENSNRRRQKQLFQVFKNKYDIEYKNRVEFEKEVRKLSRQLQAKIVDIDKILYKCMASQSTEISLPLEQSDSSIRPNSKFLFSSQFSEVGKSPNAIFTKIYEVGDVTPIDSSSLLTQMVNKLSRMQAILQIVFLRLDKYTLEHQNIQKLINGQRRHLEQEISRLRKCLNIERKQKEQIKNVLQIAEKERMKWNQALLKVKKQKNVQKLMEYQKEKLIHQIFRMKLCMDTMKKQKKEKDNELISFRQEEKKRYKVFLQRLKKKGYEFHQKQ